MSRQRARELAFRVLFQAEQGGTPWQDVWKMFKEDRSSDAFMPDEEDDLPAPDYFNDEAIIYAHSLLEQLSQARSVIDSQLEKHLRGWSFQQMAQTDLNIMRLALVEFNYMPDVPTDVSIAMAVRLAKRFGGDDSGKFVNGVLGGLVRKEVLGSES